MARHDLWTTPVASDWRSGHVSEKTASKNSRPLREVVLRVPTPTIKGLDSGSGAREALDNAGLPELKSHALNPDWEEWLMGWPVGWSSLEPLPRDEILPFDPEPNIPRVLPGSANSNRLRVIGNGQVPACAALAFKILSQFP